MIIIRIQGGLGNQLFQYAAGKCLATKLATDLKLDLSSLHHKQLRKLDLQNFCIEPQIASAKEIKKFLWFPKLYRHSPSFFSKLGKNIYREPHFHFDPLFYDIKNPSYLDGYFQSEQYFSSIENTLRRELIIKQELVQHLFSKKEEFANFDSVAVHIRRGDYMKKKSLKVHGLQPASYYNNAIHAIVTKISNPRFYFFSDDINWVKNNISLLYPHEFVSGITKSALEDFYLMSVCRHNIIANSSFSWWASWLNNNPGKIVIAPQQWFSQATHNTRDLLPPHWLRI